MSLTKTKSISFPSHKKCEVSLIPKSNKQRRTISYEERERNRFLAFFIAVILLLTTFVSFADIYQSDEIYGTTGEVDGKEADYCRGFFMDMVGTMLENVCQYEITLSDLGSAFESNGAITGYEFIDDSLSTIDELNSTYNQDGTAISYSDTSSNDSSHNFLTGAVNDMIFVWIDTDSSGNISSISLGGTSESDGFSFDLVTSMVNTVNSVTRTVGLSLLLVFFCISILQGYLEGNQYEEVFMKKLIILGLSIAFLYYIQIICAEFSNFTNSIIQGIEDEGESTISATLAVIYAQVYTQCSFLKVSGEFLNNTGRMITATFTSLSYLIMYFIPWIVTVICTALMKITCLSRFVELIVVIALAPLAMCTISSGRGIDTAIRFLKAYLALCLQGAVIYVSYIAVNYMRTDLLTNITTSSLSIGDIFNVLVTVAMVTVVQTGIVSKSRQIAQMVIGN